MNDFKKMYWNVLNTKGKCFQWWFRSLYYELVMSVVHWFYVPKESSPPNHQLEEGLIVSLTSYPPRFKKLHLSIICLLKQNIVADHVILWIAHGDLSLLPKSVTKLTKNTNFQIKTCEDVGSGKKIIPCVREYPNSFIVTADDDLYYPDDWLEILVNEYDSSRRYAPAHRIHRISLDGNNQPLPYLSWNFDVRDQLIDPLNFATSGAGIMYPPGFFNSHISDVALYIKTCKNQDDIWQYWMGRLNKSYFRNTNYEFPLISWLGSEEGSLATENLGNDQNDVAVKTMIKKLGWPNE